MIILFLLYLQEFHYNVVISMSFSGKGLNNVE